MAQITRHGNYGGARSLYGAFTGKTENVATAIAGAIHAKAGIYRPHAPGGRFRIHTDSGVYRPHAPGGRVS